MSNRSWGRGRFKKRVSTTLGKAPSSNRESNETIDLSTVRKPINTSVFGLSQILSLFETATEEVKRYIAYECDIIYECRTCRSLFRSLANFILHKRSYCQEAFMVNQCKDTDIESPYEVESVEEEKAPKRNLDAVLNRLNEIREQNKNSEEITQSELVSEEETKETEQSDTASKKICLEKIDSTSSCVFQTVSNETVGNELIKSQVMEIHSMLNTNEAILQPDGKAFKFQTKSAKTVLPTAKLICSVCNLKFSTKKTLRYHVKYKHNDTKLVYPCPDCKETFANAWGVFRHLYKIHRKTTAQIRKLRDLVHSTPIIKPQVSLLNVKEKTNEIDRENEWVNSLEGDSDFQMCSGCGKRFERRAALQSHLQLCLKRIAVSNSNAKKPLEEKTTKKVQNVDKGSKKRKPKTSVKRVKTIECPKDDIENNKLTDEESSSNKSDDNFEPVIVLYSDDEYNEVEKEKANTENEDKDEEKLNNEIIEEPLKENSLDSDDRSLEDIFANLEIDLSINGVIQGQPDVIVDLTEEQEETQIVNNKPEVESDEPILCTPPLIIDSETSNQNTSDEAITSTEKPTSKPNNKKRKRSTETTLKSKSDQYVNWELLKCTPCTTTFTSNDLLLEHMAMHFNWFRYQCKMCTFVSYNSNACLSHLQQEHKIESDDSELCVIPISNNKAIKLSSNFKPFNNTETRKDGEKSPQLDKMEKGDPMVRKMIMEVIFGPAPAGINRSQLRSRNCAKTLDKDFVYDMSLVDTQIRKQAALENRVKPIKIIKNNEDFKVVNQLTSSQQRKDRKKI